MSADNWTKCPRCARKQVDEIDARQKAAADAYGKVSPEEWKKLDDAASLIPEPKMTLREDYEVGIYEEDFIVEYSGRCTECGFSFSFSQNQAVLPARQALARKQEGEA